MHNRITLKHWRNTNVFLLEEWAEGGRLLQRRFCDRQAFSELAGQARLTLQKGRLLVLETGLGPTQPTFQALAA